MTSLPVSRPFTALAGAVALVLMTAVAAQAFTFTDQAEGTSGDSKKFMDPADRVKSRMSGDSNDRSTIRNGNTSLQFGGRESFNERNNGDRYFNPNNLMGR